LRETDAGEDPCTVTSDDLDAGEDYAFAFFEVVTVGPPPFPKLAGRFATVLGRSRSEDGTEHYALTYAEHTESVMVEGDHMASTGQVRDRADFYDGTSIHVTVDGRVV
jgi:hypothetical protein